MAAAGGDRRGADATGVTPVTVRLGVVSDAAAAARLHSGQIAEGFLSSLGPRFLERLYRRVCRAEDSFLLVAERSGEVVGFVAGSTDTRGLFATFLVRDGAVAALSAPWRLLSSVRHVAETLRHGRRRAGPISDRPAPDSPTPLGELLAIAVDPELRGRGVGRQLVGALLTEAARRGVATVEVVVGADNSSALGLYTASGFVPVRRFELHRGTESVALHHRPSTTPQSTAPGQSTA